MNRPTATIGGPPGSGKTTAARRVAAALGLELVSAGDLFRAEAQRRGMDLAAFSRYAEEHLEVDRGLDGRMADLATPECLLEGRIQGPLLRRRGVPVAYVVVTAAPEVRYQRIAQRDGLGLPEARSLTEVREQSERRRYQELYRLDLDREAADLTVDSTEKDRESVATEIVTYLRGRGVRSG